MNDPLPDLEQAQTPAERREILSASPAPKELAPRIQAAAVALLYSDPARAARLVAAGTELANLVADPLVTAYARRGEAHLAFLRGDHSRAADAYAEAAADFAAAGELSEEARTRSSGLQALIYLGRYERARAWAERAEGIFLAHHDTLRLARLDSNVGNIYFRLDQPRQAIARYERALEAFTEVGDDKDLAAALSNLVVAHTSLGQFREALVYHARVRTHCQERNLMPLSAQAGYNIAYLYFLRGDYTEARRAYDRTRTVCVQHGDHYHAALCDLDESELVLELNLSREGESLASRAAEGFSRLGMQYEQAKALVNLAVAASQNGLLHRAGRILLHARALFVKESNGVWPALIDLLRAHLAFQAGRFRQAKRLSVAASEALSGASVLPSRVAHCHLLLARLWLREGEADRARTAGRDAVACLGGDASPSLLFHANMLEGEVNEVQGQWRRALAHYEAARAVLEDLRGRLDTEDLRISLLHDKLAVYEALVSMCLDSPLTGEEDGRARAMLMVQQAKSRSLADRLLQPGRSAGTPDAAGGERREALRRDLNWHYRQMDLAVLLARAGFSSSNASAVLRRRAAELETELLSCPTPRLPEGEVPVLAPAETLSSLQEVIPAACAVVEYFEARGVLWAFVLTAGGLEVARLGSPAPVRQAQKLLQLQLAKAARRAGEDSVASSGLEETNHHLAELYALLVRPVAHWLAGCRHLVFAPHRHLHGLPFAALRDGSRSLMDVFTISAVPSASVYAACRRRRGPEPSGTAVIAVPDSRNPQIEAEARAVAELLPGARLFLGDDATSAVFLREAAQSGVVHLAAHGIFRGDNPMFSSLQLADGRLNLFDLGPVRLDTGLLTLSACSSGLCVPVGGDELLGLLRGFLAAGVRRIVASLWEVDDAATSEFMRAFYREAGLGIGLQEALRSAMRATRDRYPHPYHWAPFILVGDAP